MPSTLPTPPCVESENEILRLSPRSFREFADFITGKLGIKMSENKIPMLQSRLQRRLRELGLPSIEAYKTYLFDSPQAETELAHFISAVTTNKTDFFREPHHFSYLTRTALPALDGDPGRPWRFKLWCAGCSSGEEPYTLSMVLSDYALQRPGFDYVMLATDISSRVLAIAREAVYDAERVEPLSPEQRKKYLLRSRRPNCDQVRVVPALRAKVQFHPLNFMDETYPVADTFDVIFFRNVMIYFDKPTQQAVVNRLCRNLRPGGYLFVGHSESLIGLDVPVRMVASAVYRKAGSARE
ncbi:MAG: methyltransferase domain-containing protein [Opitutaceae bacterium]|nr:methyltransferase domain-containing protein [Opitutaceae bacterium]